MNDGGPAFPLPLAATPDGAVYNSAQQSVDGIGMSLRDYFAAHAIQGLLANSERLKNMMETDVPSALCVEVLVKLAFEIADEMILKRTIKQNPK